MGSTIKSVLLWFLVRRFIFIKISLFESFSIIRLFKKVLCVKVFFILLREYTGIVFKYLHTNGHY